MGKGFTVSANPEGKVKVPEAEKIPTKEEVKVETPNNKQSEIAGTGKQNLPSNVKTEEEVKELIAEKEVEIKKDSAKKRAEVKVQQEQDKKYKTVMVKTGLDKYGNPSWKAQQVLIE